MIFEAREVAHTPTYHDVGVADVWINVGIKEDTDKAKWIMMQWIIGCAR